MLYGPTPSVCPSRSKHVAMLYSLVYDLSMKLDRRPGMVAASLVAVQLLQVGADHPPEGLHCLLDFDDRDYWVLRVVMGRRNDVHLDSAQS